MVYMLARRERGPRSRDAVRRSEKIRFRWQFIGMQEDSMALVTSISGGPESRPLPGQSRPTFFPPRDSWFFLNSCLFDSNHEMAVFPPLVILNMSAVT